MIGEPAGRNVVFVMYDGLTLLDLAGPLEILGRTGARCVLAARDAVVTSDRGVRILADVGFDTVAQADVLVVPGGPGQTPAMADGALMSFLARQAGGASIVASVCTGALLLAGAGPLVGRRATTHWLARDEFARLGGVPVAARTVRDDKFASAAGVSAGIDLGLELAAELVGEEAAMEIQLGIEYDPSPPFNAGNPGTAPSDVVARLVGRSRFRQDAS